MKILEKNISNDHKVYKILNGIIKIKIKHRLKQENILDIPLKFNAKYVLNFLFGKGVTPTRYLQDKFLESVVPSLTGTILELGSGDKDFTKNLAKNCSEFIKSDFEPLSPDVIKIDATNIDLPDNSVDCVITVSMLEHIYDYQKVVDEIHRVLKPGGKVICATPFILAYHPSVEDFFRFSPAAYKTIFKNFSHADVYGFGNADLATALLLQRRRWHKDYIHLDNKSGFLNHILSCIYLIKGFINPKHDDYAQLYGIIAVK